MSKPISSIRKKNTASNRKLKGFTTTVRKKNIGKAVKQLQECKAVNTTTIYPQESKEGKITLTITRR